MTLSNLLLLQSAASTASAAPGNNNVPEIVHLLRKHLGMDVAFLGEMFHGSRKIILVDTDETDCAVRPGCCTPMEESYCKRIVDGSLPGVMPDIRNFPTAAVLPVTRELDIGSYIAAPIRLADGTIYGTFCCYSHAPAPSLNERDLAMMRVCADMAATQIDHQLAATARRRESETRIRAVLEAERLSIVYQPIYDLKTHRVVGFEALSRFNDGSATTPDVFFNEAHDVGLGPQLEKKAILLGLQGLRYFASEIYVSVNISPASVLSPEFETMFDDAPPHRVTLEITEHAAVEQYHEIASALHAARQRGMQLAVDDAGAGYASFRHILQLAPDRIKLDCSLTHNIENDPTRRALIAAFVRFSRDTGARLIAEGVETRTALQALRDLGVEKAQGHFLGRPMPLQDALGLVHA